MSERHREGLAHLLYGVSSGHGGFILLTGEVGTGKTTVCRCFLEQVPDNTDIAFIVHPKLTGRELLASICDELHIVYPRVASTKAQVDLINQHLLQAHGAGRNTVVIIDEAQNLSIEVLEQLRLLTNLETSEKKLLQIVLLGQPELIDLLQRPELRQLSQRITARYHLQALTKDDVRAYVGYRLSVAGLKREIFTPAAMTALFRLSQGIPRLINLICDRAMLGAYSHHTEIIDRKTLVKAAREVLGEDRPQRTKADRDGVLTGLLTGLAVGLAMVSGLVMWTQFRASEPQIGPATIQMTSPDTDLSAVTASAVTDSAVTAGSAVAGSSDQTTGGMPAGLQSAVGDPVAQDRARVVQFDAFGQAVAQLPIDTKGSAYRGLMQRWGISYDPNAQPVACDAAEMAGLSCLHRQGNWRSVLKLDRPAVLKLRSVAGEEFYVAVLEVYSDDVAQVQLGNQVLSVQVGALDSLWAGDYSILWRRPAHDITVIRPGGGSDAQRWLTERLLRIEAMRLAAETTGANPRALVQAGQGIMALDDGTTLEEKIRRFQLDVGLQPDGVAGAHTLIQMSSILDADVPRLVVHRPSAHPGGSL